MAVGAYKTVAPPVRSPHRFGLFSAAQVVDVTDVHELLGVQWMPLPCGPPDLTGHHCPGEEDEIKRFASQPGTVAATPIQVHGSFDCTLVGYEMSEAVARAKQHLLAGEQQTVEFAVMGGTADNGPFLAHEDTIRLGETRSADALLSALYAHADLHFVGEPVLHVPRAAVPYLRSNLFDASGRLVTRLGSPVAAGAGYTEANVGPGGEPAPPGAWWVYATGPVTVRRGPVMQVPKNPEAGFNTRTNGFKALAERQFVVGWDCLAVAALFVPQYTLTPTGGE